MIQQYDVTRSIWCWTGRSHLIKLHWWNDSCATVKTFKYCSQHNYII